MELHNLYLKSVYEKAARRDPNEKEYLQAVYEVLESLEGVFDRRPELEKANIAERIVEPERVITFRVSWVDGSGARAGQPRLSRAVQFRHRPV